MNDSTLVLTTVSKTRVTTASMDKYGHCDTHPHSTHERIACITRHTTRTRVAGRAQRLLCTSVMRVYPARDRGVLGSRSQDPDFACHCLRAFLTNLAPQGSKPCTLPPPHTQSPSTPPRSAPSSSSPPRRHHPHTLRQRRRRPPRPCSRHPRCRQRRFRRRRRSCCRSHSTRRTRRLYPGNYPHPQRH